MTPTPPLPPARVGSGLDVHAFDDDPARPLVLCGVTIPGAVGLSGHSDADTAAHAVADALLGAAALGDLGTRFGVDDPGLAGGDSLELLRTVAMEIRATGYSLANVDVTIVAQRPRLSDHRDAMRASLAAALAVDAAAVSVKLTTTDHLGAVGRGEGIAAWATALLQAAAG